MRAADAVDDGVGDCEAPRGMEEALGVGVPVGVTRLEDVKRVLVSAWLSRAVGVGEAVGVSEDEGEGEAVRVAEADAV